MELIIKFSNFILNEHESDLFCRKSFSALVMRRHNFPQSRDWETQMRENEKLRVRFSLWQIVWE